MKITYVQGLQMKTFDRLSKICHTSFAFFVFGRFFLRGERDLEGVDGHSREGVCGTRLVEGVEGDGSSSVGGRVGVPARDSPRGRFGSGSPLPGTAGLFGGMAYRFSGLQPLSVGF